MKIACCGDIIHQTSVNSDNIGKKIISPGGTICNASSILTKYGNSVDLYGKIGTDYKGEELQDMLIKDNINLEHVLCDDTFMTTRSYIINNVDNNTQSVKIEYDESDSADTLENMSYDSDYNCILLDGNYKEESMTLIHNNPNASSIMRANEVTYDTYILSNYADVVFCSEKFALEVAGKKRCDDWYDYKRLFRNIKSGFDFVDTLVIILDNNGYLCEMGDEIIEMPPYDSEKKIANSDINNDIFIGAFIHAYANKKGFYKSLEFANIALSLSNTLPDGKYSCPKLETVLEIYNKLYVENEYNIVDDRIKRLVFAPKYDINDDDID